MAHLVLFAGLGMLAGSLTRRLLGRLYRGAPIPVPWCELSLGSLWAASGYGWAGGWWGDRWLPLLLGLGWLAVAAGSVDLARRRLPDVLTLPGAPLVLALAAPLGGPALVRAALGAAALGGLFLAVRLIAPGSLGAGDVKLAYPVGAALGAVSWPALAFGTALASVATALAGGLLLAAGTLAGPRIGRAARAVVRRGLPHGPSMLLAGWFVVAVAGAGADQIA
jgi:leader peptidase (prepilin peptidase)/N-methyltransferase